MFDTKKAFKVPKQIYQTPLKQTSVHFCIWLKQSYLTVDLSLRAFREITAKISLSLHKKTMALCCQMDKDSGPCARPAGKESRGEVVRACQEIVHQQWTWKERTEKNRKLLSRHDKEQAGERLGVISDPKIKRRFNEGEKTTLWNSNEWYVWLMRC